MLIDVSIFMTIIDNDPGYSLYLIISTNTMMSIEFINTSINKDFKSGFKR